MALLESDPRDLLLGPDGDLVVGTDLQWSRGLQAIAQSCRIALLMFAGEWFLDLEAGIPYFDEILGFRSTAARLEFLAALRAVDGVTEVTTLELSFDSATRALTITWAVSTAFGDTSPDTILHPLSEGVQ